MATITTNPPPAGAASAQPGESAHSSKPKESIQDTLISVVIAFALAFVFRGFVVEAFVIPTGSMAPTLMGAHERFTSPQSGYCWPVGPWYNIPGTEGEPKPVQGQYPDRPLIVHDPMTGEQIEAANVPRRSGDRILVLKYLYSVLEPHRFDVVVFKNPGKPEQNFIKRLIGLPGEQIALVDGDVFVRKQTPSGGAGTLDDGLNDWALSGWEIARKPVRAQRTVWQPVFNSDYAPIDPTRYGLRRWYTVPWTSQESGWKIDGRTYEYSGNAPTELVWDATRVRYVTQSGQYGDPWEIDDRYPYDEGAVPSNLRYQFPVSDIRMGVGVLAQQAGLSLSATINARGHEFQMDVSDGAVTLRYRPAPPAGADGLPGAGTPGEWKILNTGRAPAFEPGRVVNVEFWHVDQTMSAWIDGRLVAGGPGKAEYNWGPAQRIEYATGRTVNQWLDFEKNTRHPNIFAQPDHRESDITHDPTSATLLPTYRKPRIRWSFRGSPVKLYRVAVDRDLHYQAAEAGPGQPARATHPLAPVTLLRDQFFVCGDNSPASHDGRLWQGPEPWAAEIDRTPGIVPRRLLLGKAFFVYFPSLLKNGPVPVPDFGRMRFIW